VLIGTINSESNSITVNPGFPPHVVTDPPMNCEPIAYYIDWLLISKMFFTALNSSEWVWPNVENLITF
jgi:hypothetical protein